MDFDLVRVRIAADTHLVAVLGGPYGLDEARLARDYFALVTNGVVSLAEDWGLDATPGRWWLALEHRARSDGLQASGGWARDDDIALLGVVVLCNPRGEPYESPGLFGRELTHPTSPVILDNLISRLRSHVERDWAETLESGRRAAAEACA